MKFRRALQRYGRTPEPETPYQRAGQLWDERIGSARVQAKNWRLMAFGGLFLASGLSAALVCQSMQSRVVPYVVEVDRLGEARAVAPADAEYRPTDPQIAWHLGRFIADVRSRSLDPVLMRENWLQAYDFATERAALFLGEYARADDPFAEVGRRTVSVQVTSVVRASDNSFRVDWTAMLTVRIQPPRAPDELRKNPLGLYVDAIDWSRELEAPAPSTAGRRAAGPAWALAPGAADPPSNDPLRPPPDPDPAPPEAAPALERTMR